MSDKFVDDDWCIVHVRTMYSIDAFAQRSFPSPPLPLYLHRLSRIVAASLAPHQHYRPIRSSRTVSTTFSRVPPKIPHSVPFHWSTSYSTPPCVSSYLLYAYVHASQSTAKGSRSFLSTSISVSKSTTLMLPQCRHASPTCITTVVEIQTVARLARNSHFANVCTMEKLSARF